MMVPSVLTIQGKSVPLKCTYSSRAKRLSLRLSPRDGAFSLSVPSKATPLEIERFLKQCSAWMVKQLEKVSTPLSIKSGEGFSLYGVPYQGVTDPLRRKPALCQKTKTLFLPPSYEQKKLHDVFKKHAESQLVPYVLEVAQKLGQDVQKVTIRDATLRWGSCSSQRKISLNWRLILAPFEVAQYVCIHEVVHLLYMNHSRAFWKQVSELCPLYRTHQKWLKTHGFSLMQV